MSKKPLSAKDRKLPKGAKPRESWLGESSSHEEWAAAMACCRSSSGFCGADGECHLGGECFEDPKPTVEDRLAKLERDVAALQELVFKRGGAP